MIVNGSTSWDDNKIENLNGCFIDGQNVDFFLGSPNSLFSCARKNAENNPNKIFLYDEANVGYTFEQIYFDAVSYAKLLREQYGIQRGSRIGILLETSYPSCVLILAINALGAISVMLPTKHKINEINTLIEKTAPDLIIYDDKFESLPISGKSSIQLVKIVDERRDLTDEDYKSDSSFTNLNLEDPAFIIFTSGTTSRAKGVILKNYHVVHAVVSYANILELSSSDSSILCTPIYYVTGLIAIFGLLLFLGGTIYLHRKFNAVRVLNTVCSYKITFLHGSPTVFYLLLKEKDHFPSLPSLKQIICGSGNFPKGRISDIYKWIPGVDIRTVYGLTETSSPGTIMPHNAATSPFIGSSGKPIPGLSIKIVDESGNELETGQNGEILVKGTNVFTSYYGYDNSPLENGWFSTGDIGYINAQRYLFIVDRKKNIINRGGEKILCYDVENELCHIPGIVDAAVVALPDEKYGEIPAAAVVQIPENRWSATDITNFLKNRLASFQVPVYILFLSAIPQTANLKHDKKEIINLFKSKEREK